MLLTTCGSYSEGGATWFYVSDGSLPGGVKVDASYLTEMPAPGNFVIVTGICTVEQSGSDLIAVLRPRSSGDVVIYTP
jgi:hypothetical protein